MIHTVYFPMKAVAIIKKIYSEGLMLAHEKCRGGFGFQGAITKTDQSLSAFILYIQLLNTKTGKIAIFGSEMFI